MPIDSSIPLSVRPIDFPNPVQTIGSLMQMRGQIAEVAQRQALAAQEQQNTINLQMKAEQDRRDLADQNTIGQAMKDPTLAPKLWTGDTSGLPIQPKSAMSWKENIEKLTTQHTTNAVEQNKLASENLAKINNSLDGLKLLAATDPEAAKSAYPSMLQNLRAQHAFEGLPAGQVPETLDDPKQLDQLSASVGGYKALIDTALARQKETASIAETTGKASELAAKLPGQQAESEKQVIQTQILKQALAQIGSDPQSGPSVIDKILPPELDATANNAYKTAYKQAAATDKPLEAMNAVITAASAHAAALSPQKRAIEIQQDVAKQKALIPGEVGKMVAAEKAKIPLEMGMRQETAASGEYEKSLATLSSAAADASRIHNLIQAAQNGNKAAPGLIPLAELRQYVNRVNSTELRNVSSAAGSWADKVEGFLKGATEGQPIPPDVLKATDELASLQLTNAEQKHKGEVAAINQARGTQKAPKTASDLGFSSISNSSSAPPLPAILSAADVGKVYTSPKTGKRMKITAVNPANNKQFQSQEVP